jgi:hypothetical protein
LGELQLFSIKKAKLTHGGSLIFAEVIKKYPRKTNSENKECELISYQKCWILLDPKPLLLASEYNATDCIMNNVATGDPFGIIHIKGKNYIVIEDIGYEGESYSILKFENGKLEKILETLGGGC